MKTTLPKILKYTITSVVLTGATIPQLVAQGKKLNVLFIGNSYTATNDLPGMTKSAALSAGDTLIIDSYSPGGVTLKGHASSGPVATKISVGTWNYVVLQDQSQSPALPDGWVDTEVKPYAKQLNDMILKANKCGRTIFYQTWGYRDGDASNCGHWPPVCTYEGMDSMLKKRYNEMAMDNNALLAPVGSVRKEIRARYPAIDLYQADGSHPTEVATFAAAATFYTVLFRKDPRKITFTASVPAADAKQILQIVYDVVYKDLAKFYVYKYDPTADFTSSATGLTVNFNSAASLNVVNYSWTFGDGNKDATASPIHTYTTAGTYTVRLITDNCSIMDTMEKKITVSKSGTAIAEQSLATLIKVFPNPVQNTFTIQSDIELREVTGTLSNMMGAQLITGIELKKTVDLSGLSSGLYLLQLKNNTSGETATYKVIKQ